MAAVGIPSPPPAATPCLTQIKIRIKKERNKKRTRLPQKSDKGRSLGPDSVWSAPKIKHVEQQLYGGAGAGAAAAGAAARADNEEAAMWHVECVGLCG